MEEKSSRASVKEDRLVKVKSKGACLEALNLIKDPLSLIVQEAKKSAIIADGQFSLPNGTMKCFKEVALGSYQAPGKIVRKAKNSTICAYGKLIGKSYGKDNKFEANREKLLYLFLDHPHILKIHGIFQDRILLEKAKCSLLECINPKHSYCSYQSMKSYIRGVIAALEYIHSRGIIHMDVKAENVLVFDSKLAKLGDFGGAATLDLQAEYVFTSVYAAPEVIKGKAISPKADVWALGIMIYYCIFGANKWNMKEVETLDPSTPHGMDPQGLLRGIIKSCLVSNVLKRASIEDITHKFPL